MKTEIEAFYIFVGEDLFQARKQFVRSEAEGPTQLCSLQVT